MIDRFAIFRIISAALILAVQMSAASAADETPVAPLPAEIFTAPDLCAHVSCPEVMPGADSFSDRKGKPSYVEAYKTEANEKKLVGYVFLSTDIVDTPGYSGRPVVTLIGMDTNGRITGVKILHHHELILELGFPEDTFTKFTGQYVGKFVNEKIEVGKSQEAEDYIRLDAITGATSTAIAQSQVILRSAIEIARQVGIIEPTIRPQAVFTEIKDRLSWNEMVSEGSIQRLTVSADDIGAEGDGDYIDMYFGYLNVPALGKSVLGEKGYDGLIARLRPGEHAIFIIADGVGSFKGSSFARGGIYERIQVTQEMDTFIFRDLDYLYLEGVEAENAPAYRESGIFVIRSDRFSSAYPWTLALLASKIDKQTGARTFARFGQEYWLPARYLEGGHPAVKRPEPASPSVWKGWKTGAVMLGVFLAAIALILGLRGKRVRRAGRTGP